MELIDQVKQELKTFSEDILTKVSERATSTSEEAKAEIKTMKDALDEATKKVEEMEKQLQESKRAGLPGLDEELKKKNFSWQSFIGGLYKQVNPNAVGHGNPWKDAEYEKEICEEYAKVRANTAGDGSQGGYLIPQEITSEVIDLAMAAIPLMDMGVTKLTGLYGELPVPKLTGRPTGYWVAENEKPTESENTYGVVNLRPKKLGAFTKQSNRLIYQSRGTSDSIIKQQLSNAMALKLHEGLVTGTGTESQPLGVMNTSGMTSSTAGTSGAINGRFRLDHAAVMRRDLDVADELHETGSFGYLMRPEVKSGLSRERVLQYSGQTENTAQPILAINPLMSDQMIENILGNMLRTSTQLSATESSGGVSTSSSVIFGNWKYLWVAFWRDLMIKVSDTAGDGSTGSAFLDDQLYIVSFQEVDAQVMRATAFTKVTGAYTTESDWS